jgi:hypothetical protein
MSKRSRTSFMWEVVPVNLYLIYPQDSPPESGIHADLLVEATGEGKLTGSFRWSLRCKDTLRASFSGKGMSSYSDMEGFELLYDMKPCNLPLRHNTSNTAWEDLADLVSEGRVTVTKNGEEASQELISKRNADFSRKPNVLQKKP